MKILCKILDKVLEWIIRAAIVAAITMPAADTLTAAAYRERGYEAVGGEWLAIILIAGALWFLSGNIIKYMTSDPENEKKERKADRENGTERVHTQHSRHGSSPVFDHQELEHDEMG